MTHPCAWHCCQNSRVKGLLYCATHAHLDARHRAEVAREQHRIALAKVEKPPIEVQAPEEES